MLRMRIEPPEITEMVADEDTWSRLAGGDALDLAMFGPSLLGMITREAQEHGAAAVEFDVDNAGTTHDGMAEANGYTMVREVLQLRRELPLDQGAELELRAFVPGQDDDAWLAVNNRAFTWHPDQADWTVEDLRARMDEAWFDPAGFLLHEDGGAIDGFCWTKVHDEERPFVGEIFVIGVDPSAQGHGLGRALVLAGLDHLAQKGLEIGMIHVEADNERALRLYDDLGFEVRQHHRWYRREFG